MHTGAKTVVRKVYGNSNCFEIKVCMHKGSALSPLLFVIVMEYGTIMYRNQSNLTMEVVVCSGRGCDS